MKQFLLDSPYNSTENSDLAQAYIRSLPQTTELVSLLKKIYRELDKFSVVVRNGREEIDALSWDAKEKTLVHKIYQKNILTGVNQLQIIVKKLRRFDHTYELRINSQHHFYRILFQFNNLKESNNHFIILSYGFTKYGGNTDLTDTLALSNDKIKEDTIGAMQSKTAFSKWLSQDTISKL